MQRWQNLAESPQVNRSSRLPRRHLILAGVRVSYLQSGISLLVGFVTTPLYLKYLGGELFGLWMTLWSIMGYLHLSTVGMPMTSSVRIAEAYARGEGEKVGRLLTTSFLMWLASAMIGTGILVFLIGSGVIHAALFHGSKAVIETAIPALVVLAVGSLAFQPLDVFRLAVRSFQRVDIEQSYTIIFKVVMLGVAVSVLALGGGLLGLALATSLSHLGLGLTFGMIVHRSVSGLRLRSSLFDTQMARSFIAPSLHFFALSLAGSLIWGTDNLVISAHLGPTAVTPFAVALQILHVGSSLIATGINSMIPAVTALHTLGEEAKLRQTLIRAVKIGFAQASLLGVVLACFGEEFLRLWVGPLHIAPASVLGVLLTVLMIRSFAMCFEIIVVGTLRHYGYTYMALGEGVLNLVLSLILIRWLGLLGVALGTLIAHVACTGWFLPAMGMRLTRSHPYELALKSVFPTLPAVVVAACTAQLFIGLPISTGWGWLLTGSSITAGIFIALFWSVGLDTEEKELFLLMWKKVRSV